MYKKVEKKVPNDKHTQQKIINKTLFLRAIVSVGNGFILLKENGTIAAYEKL